MTAKALGLIEAIGLTAAIEAADAAAKAANVTVLGYDNAKGGGLITVKLAGDVGAVKAAVSAGSAAGQRVGRIAACLVIPRPHEEIAALVAQVTRGQVVRPSAAPVAAPPVAPVPEIAIAEPSAEPVQPEAAPAEPVAAEAAPIASAAQTLQASAEATEKRKPAPVKRGKAPKSDMPATPDSGEVEG